MLERVAGNVHLCRQNAMGEHMETVAVDTGGKDNRFRSCETKHEVLPNKSGIGIERRQGENGGQKTRGGENSRGYQQLVSRRKAGRNQKNPPQTCGG